MAFIKSLITNCSFYFVIINLLGNLEFPLNSLGMPRKIEYQGVYKDIYHMLLWNKNGIRPFILWLVDP